MSPAGTWPMVTLMGAIALQVLSASALTIVAEAFHNLAISSPGVLPAAGTLTRGFGTFLVASSLAFASPTEEAVLKFFFADGSCERGYSFSRKAFASLAFPFLPELVSNVASDFTHRLASVLTPTSLVVGLIGPQDLTLLFLRQVCDVSHVILSITA